jgi:ABC-type transporter lipoprotein component MlaA
MAVYPFFVDTIYVIGPTVVETVNTRARYLETVEQAKDAAVDYYTFVRSAYLQRRAALVEDRATTERPAHDEEDLYFPGEE